MASNPQAHKEVLMIKHHDNYLKKTVLSVIFICTALSVSYVHCSDEVDIDFGHRAYLESVQKSFSFLKYQDSSDSFLKREQQNSLISWVSHLGVKMVESKNFFPWNTQTLTEDDPFNDEVSGMQYELYEGEFQRIDYIRKDIVKALIPRTVEELLKKTRTGKKLDLLSRKLSSYFTIQYLKPEYGNSGEFHLPGDVQEEHNRSQNINNSYGLSLSARLFNDINTDPLKYAIDLNAFYLSTSLGIVYEPDERKLQLTLSDWKLEELLGCKAALEFVTEHSETYGVIKIYFDF